jgi:DNA-binding transcriptional LysR family regulator
MLRVTFRQLEAFYWAATLGTVNAAAKHLFVSQPAITARVKELEDILGLALLSRSQQGVQLTPAGRDVLAHVQTLLRTGEELEQFGRQEVPPLNGVLRLGADETSASVAVSEILRQLKLRYPKLRVDLSIEVSKVLHEKINRRELDVSLQTLPVARPHVTDVLLGWVQVSWVAGAGMELAHLPLTPGDAASIPVLTNPAPSVLHYAAREWLSRAQRDFHHLNTCNSLSTIMRIVQDGHAIAALPLPVVLEKLKQGVLRPIEADPPLPPIAYHVSYLTEKRGEGVETLVDLCRKVLEGAQFFMAPNELPPPAPSLSS